MREFILGSLALSSGERARGLVVGLVSLLPSIIDRFQQDRIIEQVLSTCQCVVSHKATFAPTCRW